MGSARKPRGRLPQRVYWVRRSIVLVVALLLVFGVGKLIGGLGQDSPGTATPSSNNAPPQQVPSGSVTLGPVAPSATGRAKGKQPLPEPEGECVDEDVRVQPSVPQASVGTPVVIQLQLQGTQLACTFDVSPQTMVVKIESGKDRIWSSQDCPKAIPTTQVVVRSSQATPVPVSWSGRRSDDNCTNTPDWVLPGYYHVYAAALGSTPTDVQFRVTRAAPKTVTRTPHPRKHASTSASGQPTAKTSGKSTPTAKPSGKPSPTVKGKQSKCGGENAASSC